MTLVVRPVRFTDRPAEWSRLLTALGGTVLDGHPAFTRYAMGAGVVAVHPVTTGDSRCGSTSLVIESTELTGTPDDSPIADAMGGRLKQYAHGWQVEIDTAQGRPLLIDRPAVRAPAPDWSAVSVLALWMTTSVFEMFGLLERVGLTGRIRSHTDNWGDLSADGGGLIAVHVGTGGVVLSFEHPDVSALGEQCAAVGVESRQIDENYGLTMRLVNPDGGSELWVNQRQTDLYGFRRLSH